MKNTPQTETQSVYEHGRSVWEYTKKIISGDLDNLKLPENFITNHRYIVNNLHPTKEIKSYNIFHDCGKPYCLEIDSEGKRHFPNHAEISSNTWEKLNDNLTIKNLISLDMMLHTDTDQEIKDRKLSKKTYFTLLVTSLAEIHSNAEMFGGIESTSFKIKWKKLKQRCNLILNMFPENIDYHPYSYIIVRNDLPNSAKAIQGTHASIERFKSKSINYHPSVIYIVVKNENKLKQVIKKLLERDIDISIFREPMESFNNSITSVCTEPLEGDKRNYLKKFMLMK